MDLDEGNEIKSSHEAFKRFMDVIEDEDWVCTSTRTLPDGRVFDMLERKTDTKLPVLKCVGIIKTSPEKLLDFFLNADLETRKKVTPNLSKYEIINFIVYFVQNPNINTFIFSRIYPQG